MELFAALIAFAFMLMLLTTLRDLKEGKMKSFTVTSLLTAVFFAGMMFFVFAFLNNKLT